MSRVRIAALTASFNYLQYALAIASGLVLVPLTIGAVGPRSYGLWLATGELLVKALERGDFAWRELVHKYKPGIEG